MRWLDVLDALNPITLICDFFNLVSNLFQKLVSRKNVTAIVAAPPIPIKEQLRMPSSSVPPRSRKKHVRDLNRTYRRCMDTIKEEKDDETMDSEYATAEDGDKSDDERKMKVSVKVRQSKQCEQQKQQHQEKQRPQKQQQQPQQQKPQEQHSEQKQQARKQHHEEKQPEEQQRHNQNHTHHHHQQQQKQSLQGRQKCLNAKMLEQICASLDAADNGDFSETTSNRVNDNHAFNNDFNMAINDHQKLFRNGNYKIINELFHGTHDTCGWQFYRPVKSANTPNRFCNNRRSRSGGESQVKN